MRLLSTTCIAAGMLVTTTVATARPAEPTLEEPQPPGWEVPAGEQGASPPAPDVAPPPVEAAEPERDSPDLELDPDDESTREDGDSDS